MYAWIWRHLPLGLPGKIAGSLLLVGGAAALLWFVAFPWLDPFIEEQLLPWDDSQVELDSNPGADTVDPDNPTGPDDPAVPEEELVGPDGEVLENEHDLPYETE